MVRAAQKNNSEKWLLLDAGNSALTVQALHSGSFSDLFSVKNDDIPNFIQKIKKSGLIDKDTKIALSSVIPKMTHFIQSKFKTNPLWIAGQNLPVPLRHKYKVIKKLGADRKLNAYGAILFHYAPCLVFDFGTALTIDYISSKNCFEGGWIIPGPQTAYTSLGCKTTLLPKKKAIPVKIEGFLGRDTRQCMENGLILGYAAMASGFIQQFKRRHRRLKVIFTGGLAPVIAPYVPENLLLDPAHTLRSLAFAALAHTSRRAS